MPDTLGSPEPRRATPGDIPALVRVINAAYRVEDFFVDGDRTNDGDVAARMAAPSACFLVIDGAGRGDLNGAVYVDVRGERGYFGMLSVDPELQGRGLGRVLVTAAEEHCRAAGCRFVDIDVVNLRVELPAFYRKLGYSPMGTAPFYKGEKLRQEAHLVLMTKPLVAARPIPPAAAGLAREGVSRYSPSARTTSGEPMAQNKTKATDGSVPAFVRSVADAKRRQECLTILELMREITGEEPTMWGSSIVGFGTYHYKYQSGREGDYFLTGFSPRKQSLTLYLMAGFDDLAALRTRLGKHTTGKSCLYIKQLEDVDLGVLKQMIEQSVAATKK